jgi:restriction system protein
MPIGFSKEFMVPILKVSIDGNARSRADLTSAVANLMGLNEEERNELTNRGDKTKILDRVHWASYHLSRAGLLELDHGKFKITSRGLDVLKEGVTAIDQNYLRRFPEFITFLERRGKTKRVGLLDVVDMERIRREIEEMHAAVVAEETPSDQIGRAVQAIEEQLAQELLERISASSPQFFENLVVLLLRRMYGGFKEASGQVVGRSGDGGIDGIIQVDRLGLDVIYVQAKRWTNKVGEPEIRDFAGSLLKRSAQKGVFITASSFQNSAISYVENHPIKIRLVDGEELAALCIEFGIGTISDVTYSIKKIDPDFFGGE